MKMTLKKNINLKSLVLKHNILLEVSNLTVGREGVLQTEKNLYLVLAFMDNLVEEDLIQEINEDGRDLTTIMLEDIEPKFMELIEQEGYKELYDEMLELHLQRCKEIWQNQHSIVGLVDALLLTIASMSDEAKEDALVETGKLAEAAFNRRTSEMKGAVEETNSKLEEFIKAYREQINKNTQTVEEKKEEDTK